jgi:hypothetical protein
MGLTLRAFAALADGHARADRLREARLVGAIRVAVSGSRDEVQAFLKPGLDPGRAADFDSVEALLQQRQP